ncbi:alcohol dehydrogenase zinc-binding domain-containing protein [Periconia macrospinosa]|uniref:Alcohol dehydrogenase zinc-binding domain-containing protein n=1 Tax=Periconia macrospinosa TaxID=97972 RepID=A0A2V1DJ19_9PLEO|nr:alcohol dehydrogenase zinc-binding domain-containing protein [Periconia macrospinosa]
MKAIIVDTFGPPSNLLIKDVPKPIPKPGQVLIRIKAFGLNRAELYMRRGEWAESMPIIGIECVGIIEACPDNSFPVKTAVAALMGGLGRTINGSYAEYTVAPVLNVATLAESEDDLCLSWEQAAAIPETYATAWMCLFGNLELKKGQKLLVRGATSALGLAAVTLAAHFGARVTGTTRNPGRHSQLIEAGAETVEPEDSHLAERLNLREAAKFDTVLELVGNSTLLESLALVRRGGRLCLAGFVGGVAPINFNPLLQMVSGVHFSFFGSFVLGTEPFPLSEVPLQEILKMVASGELEVKPSRVFRFDEIQEAHEMMEANEANGKLVILGC